MSDVPGHVSALRLESRLDIVAAEALQVELLKLAPTKEVLTVDAQDVELIDTPAIQILLAAEASQLDRGARFLAVSD